MTYGVPPSRDNKAIAILFSRIRAYSTPTFVVSSVMLTTVAFDQATKWAVLKFLSTSPYKVEVTFFLDLSLGFNSGVSFGLFASMLSDQQWPIIAVSFTIALALATWALYTTRLIEGVAIAQIAGGAFGNIIDRIRQGAVSDFLDFHLMGFHWPTFNFADVFIFVGALSLVVTSKMSPVAEGRKYIGSDDKY